MPRTPPPQYTLALLALLALAGCTHEKNDRLRFGESGTLSSFEIKPHPLPPTNPGITGLDRDNWEPVTLLIPVNGTAHQPTYAPSAFALDTLARQRGEYPTAESALELGEPFVSEELQLAAQTHGLALVDAILLVPRLILRPPTATDWSPTLSYGRAPEADITATRCGPKPTECGQSAPTCEEPPAETPDTNNTPATE